jgi:CheY-like chemotaxis protein
MTSTSKEPNSNFKILLVEDDPSNQLLMKFCLTKTSFSYDLAENGQEAVEKFKQGAYDLVLMDINMPVMDGYEATQNIREFEKKNQRRETTIMALTANVTQEDRQKCMQSGCTDIIEKPFKVLEFLNTLKQIAERILSGKKSL